jgi:hypothetical protein
LIRQEGLLCGGSSGAAAWAAMQVCQRMKPGQRVVVILPDSIRNYLSKFVSDAWMRQHGFLQSDWELGTMGDLLRTLGPRPVITLEVDARIAQATELFKRHGISQIPVVDKGVLAGILTELDVMQQLVSGRCTSDTTVAEAMVRRVSTVNINQPAGELPQIFERGEVALVVDQCAGCQWSKAGRRRAFLGTRIRRKACPRTRRSQYRHRLCRKRSLRDRNDARGHRSIFRGQRRIRGHRRRRRRLPPVLASGTRGLLRA